MTEPTAIAILAGGQSRRMGRDKALLEYGGTTLLDRMINAAQKVTDTVAVIGRSGEREDILWLEDDAPGFGPLGGLKTALKRLDQPLILLACDMPKVDVDALEWLLEKARKSNAEHGVATTRDGQIEPLFSLYRPALLAHIDAPIAARRLSLRRLIERRDFTCLEAPPRIAQKLLNINTPQDLAALPSPPRTDI